MEGWQEEMISRLQSFLDSPLTKAADAAAVVTGAGAAAIQAYPDFRATLHDYAAIFVDIAPIATVLWLLIQGVCKIIVTYHVVHPNDDEGEN